MAMGRFDLSHRPSLAVNAEHRLPFLQPLSLNSSKIIIKLWADWVHRLMALKPHKRLYFQQGFLAMSLMQQAM
jgi:hypothetical protein